MIFDEFNPKLCSVKYSILSTPSLDIFFTKPPGPETKLPKLIRHSISENFLLEYDAYFSNANLKNTDFRNANLIDVYFIEANLEGAYLEGANLEGANLECVNHEICK